MNLTAGATKVQNILKLWSFSTKKVGPGLEFLMNIIKVQCCF